MWKWILMIPFIQSVFSLDITKNYCVNQPSCLDSRCWLSTPCRYDSYCMYKEIGGELKEYSCSCNYKTTTGIQAYQIPDCDDSYSYISLIDNNNNYCVVGDDNEYYPNSPDKRYGGIWCKENEYERDSVFKLIKTNENNKYYLKFGDKYCRNEYWRRTSYDGRYRIECRQTTLNYVEKFELVLQSDGTYKLKDSANKWCFSDGITGIRCRWSSGGNFKIKDAKYTICGNEYSIGGTNVNDNVCSNKPLQKYTTVGSEGELLFEDNYNNYNGDNSEIYEKIKTQCDEQCLKMTLNEKEDGCCFMGYFTMNGNYIRCEWYPGTTRTGKANGGWNSKICSYIPHNTDQIKFPTNSNTKWCDDSPPQTCRMGCSSAKCGDNECALREGNCCSYSGKLKSFNRRFVSSIKANLNPDVACSGDGLLLLNGLIFEISVSLLL